jgi:hypothetical protein
VGAARAEERQAKLIVEQALGVALAERDHPGAPPGLHDFDILWPDRRPGALEVTILTDEPWHRLRAALAEHGDVIHTEELRRRWLIGSKEAEYGHPPFREIRKQLVSHLARVEAEGRNDFTELDRWSSPSVSRLLSELPIDHGHSYDSLKQPRVIINAPGRTAMVSPDATHSALEEEISSERFSGERTKLAASGAEERHLFVWLDSIRFEEWSGLCDAQPPAKSPAVPEEVTAIWLAAMCPAEPVVWRAEPPHPWELIRSST